MMIQNKDNVSIKTSSDKDIAREKKCHRIRLESGNQRKESHEFYKHLGFEQSGFSFTKKLD